MQMIELISESISFNISVNFVSASVFSKCFILVLPKA